ncbi:DUF4252 domain-containing protein [Tenacibaculum sp. M341]|uniref:DUF4252 domain-containing protein n=1 Tax=Tenacibaculum sp. M341 TaxID=2530339 RepID=UPI001042AC36|nr:DUF4252 domain-containing protein [Tenacibaculum sp. M341]TCI85048.1 DUF4252 domain-containing protein [Tenacibaculum sp. M341]
MKRITTIIVLFLTVSITAQKNTFKQFYKSHKADAEVSLNLPGFLVRMFMDDDDIDEEELLEKASNFKVMVFEKPDTKVASDFRKYIKRNNFKTLVRAKDGKDRAEIYFLERNDHIREIVLRVGSKEDELVLLGLKTKLTKDELAAIVSSANVEIAAK